MFCSSTLTTSQCCLCRSIVISFPFAPAMITMVDGGPCHLNLDKCHFGAFALLFFLGEQPRIICSFTNTATCQTVMCNVSPPFAGVYLSASSWSSPCKWFGYLGSFYYFIYANMDKRKNGWRYVSACRMEAC